MRCRVWVMAALVGLAACGSPQQPEAAKTEPAPAAPPAAETAASHSDQANPFTVDLTLSPKAFARLKETNERVRLMAWSFVPPKPGVPVAPGDRGVPLGEEEVIIPPVAAQTVRFNGRYDPQIVQQSGEGAPRVLINVMSARATQPDNLLECGIFEDTLPAAQTSPIKIACKLIGE